MIVGLFSIVEVFWANVKEKTQLVVGVCDTPSAEKVEVANKAFVQSAAKQASIRIAANDANAT